MTKSLSTAYPAVHQRMRRVRGSASEHACVECGATAAAWAYDKSDPHELTAVVQGRRVTYSADIGRYEPMCTACHKLRDQPSKTHCKNGHELTPENTYIRKSGGRLCRLCRLLTKRAWREAHPDWRSSPERIECRVDGCDDSVFARGWCSKHYSRWQRHGAPLAGGPERNTSRGRTP
jgi:hypothetical protein